MGGFDVVSFVLFQYRAISLNSVILDVFKSY